MVNGLPGGGPWRIDPTCAGRLHNSLSSCRARNPRGGKGGNAKCTCPRAVELLKQDNALRRARKPEVIIRADRKVKAPTYLSNVKKTVALPDLSLGLCRTPIGMMIMDEASETSGRAKNARKEEARAMCEDRCPVYVACFNWITSGTEHPAGSWGHVYAGMTADQRVELARRKRREAEDGRVSERTFDGAGGGAR